jgi:hypothetical protein
MPKHDSAAFHFRWSLSEEIIFLFSNFHAALREIHRIKMSVPNCFKINLAQWIDKDYEIHV